MKKFITTELKVPIKQIHKNKWNPNQQSPEIFAKLVKSIKQYGFTQPILVREVAGDYEIIDGEHRWRACIELDFKEVPITNIGEIDDNVAKTLTILMNRLRGEDDALKLATILKQLNEGQLQLLPYSKQEINNLKELVEFDFSQYDKIEEIPVSTNRNRNCIFVLTNDEFRVVEKALRMADKDRNVALIKIVKEFLELREFIKK